MKLTENAAKGKIRHNAGPIPNVGLREVAFAYVNGPEGQQVKGKKKEKQAMARKGKKSSTKKRQTNAATLKDGLRAAVSNAKRAKKAKGESFAQWNHLAFAAVGAYNRAAENQGAARINRGKEMEEAFEIIKNMPSVKKMFNIKGESAPSKTTKAKGKTTKAKGKTTKAKGKTTKARKVPASPVPAQTGLLGSGKDGRVLARDLTKAIAEGRLSVGTVNAACGTKDSPLAVKGKAAKKAAKEKGKPKKKAKKAKGIDWRLLKLNGWTKGAIDAGKALQRLGKDRLLKIKQGDDDRYKGQINKTVARFLYEYRHGNPEKAMRMKNPAARKKARAKNPMEPLGQSYGQDLMEIGKQTAFGLIGYVIPGAVDWALHKVGLGAKLVKMLGTNGEKKAQLVSDGIVLLATGLTAGLSGEKTRRRKYGLPMAVGAFIRTLRDTKDAFIPTTSKTLRGITGLSGGMDGFLGGDWTYDPNTGGYYIFNPTMGNYYVFLPSMGSYYIFNPTMGAYYEYQPTMGGLPPAGYEQSVAGLPPGGYELNGPRPAGYEAPREGNPYGSFL